MPRTANVPPVLARHLEFDSIDDVQCWAIKELLSEGGAVSPRGATTLELINAAFTLRNPRARCIVNAERRWSLPLALGEFCWHLSGSDDVEFLAYYAEQWRKFADDRNTIQGSCYGKRIFRTEGRALSQWQKTIETLRADASTRRAVLFFASPVVEPNDDSQDVACATTMQFLIRNDYLHASVHMRSNDVIWGLPYDVFLFTMFHELMACELNVPLGTYHHVATSLHLYEHHFKLGERILSSARPTEGFVMPVMDSVSGLQKFLLCEKELRLLSQANCAPDLPKYWRELVHVLNVFRLHKKKLIDLSSEVARSPYYRLLAPIMNI